jgi:predicted membrane metal-binding protein
MIKAYLKLVLIFVGMVIVYGFLAPFLVSSTSDELPLLGILLLIIAIPLNLWGIFCIALDVPAIKNNIVGIVELFKKKWNNIKEEKK